MSKQSDRRQKKAKQRQRANRRVANTRRSGRSPAELAAAAMRRAAQFPLHECWIGEAWQSSRLATVIVSRRRPDGGVAVAVFLVDLGCLGVKSCFGKHDMSSIEYLGLLDSMRSTADKPTRCDPALAAKVVWTGLRYATALGFEPDVDFRWVSAILAGIDPEACDQLVECGQDGKPVYVAGPDDNPRRILNHLQRRLGPDGFHFVGSFDDEVAFEHDPLESELRQCATLKRALLEFGQSPAMRGELERYQRFLTEGDEEYSDDHLDIFLHTWPLADGRKVVEVFADDADGLSPDDRETVRQWTDRFDGIFRIERHGGDHYVLHNLVDELSYRVRSNMGRAFFVQAPSEGYIMGALVPFGDEWLFSGPMRLLPVEDGDAAAEIAHALANEKPRLAFRNPEKLAEAWKRQGELHDDFIAHFGARAMACRGRELQARMDRWLTTRVRHRKPSRGESAEEVGSIVSFPIPQVVRESNDAGVLLDPTWGMVFLERFGTFQDTFREPNLISDPSHREVVLGYLESHTIEPAPFIWAAERWPEGINHVMSSLCGLPDFDWTRDGEALMRQHKAWAYARPPVPYVLPVDENALRPKAED